MTKNKFRFVQIRAKKENYSVLKKKAEICESKTLKYGRRISDNDVKFQTHKITLDNEKVQLDRLQVEVARYIVSNLDYKSNELIRRLIFEVKSLELKNKNFG